MGQEYTRLTEVIPASGISPKIIFHENFEYTRALSISGSGYDFGRRDPRAAYTGQYGLYLKTLDTQANNWISAYFHFGSTPARLVEIIILLRVPGTSGDPDVFFDFCRNEAGKLEYYSVKYDYSEGNWLYRDKNGNYVGLYAPPKQLKIGKWHRISLVINRVEKKYHQLSVGWSTCDMSALEACLASGESNVIYSYLQLHLQNNTTIANELYVSEILIKPIV